MGRQTTVLCIVVVCVCVCVAANGRGMCNSLTGPDAGQRVSGFAEHKGSGVAGGGGFCKSCIASCPIRGVRSKDMLPLWLTGLLLCSRSVTISGVVFMVTGDNASYGHGTNILLMSHDITLPTMNAVIFNFNTIQLNS